jgi:ABC-2 type transport system ATP-binding protein
MLELVELRERADDRVSEYSQGMRQRLGIAACLVRQPRLLMLDEPANGLDPGGIRFLRRLLHRLAEEGVTVLLSSHLLAEVQEMCSRVAVIAGGRIVYEGGLEDLLRGAGRRYRLQTSDLPATAEVLERVAGAGSIVLADDELSFAVDEDADTQLLALNAALADAGIAVRALAPEQLTLEHVFFELTERQAVTA